MSHPARHPASGAAMPQEARRCTSETFFRSSPSRETGSKSGWHILPRRQIVCGPKTVLRKNRAVQRLQQGGIADLKGFGPIGFGSHPFGCVKPQVRRFVLPEAHAAAQPPQGPVFLHEKQREAVGCQTAPVRVSADPGEIRACVQLRPSPTVADSFVYPRSARRPQGAI